MEVRGSNPLSPTKRLDFNTFASLQDLRQQVFWSFKTTAKVLSFGIVVPQETAKLVLCHGIPGRVRPQAFLLDRPVKAAQYGHCRCFGELWRGVMPFAQSMS